MRILVLGGTGWLSGWVTRCALAAGHRVTCLSRGRSGAAAPGSELVQADRARPDAYDEVTGRDWDVVVDVSSQPGQVRAAVDALSLRAGHFVYVSSASVYADNGRLAAGAERRLLPPLDAEVLVGLERYGEAKVACERYVLAALGARRTLVARAGLIGGPGDQSDRSGYWPWRFARPALEDGAVLVPEASGLHAQLVDVRDVAAWLVDAGCRGVSGIFDVTGHAVPLTEHLQVARGVAGHVGPLTVATDGWLLDSGVQPWMGERSLPLWLPGEEYAGFNTVDNRPAREVGLSLRPLAATLTDTLEWELGRRRTCPRGAGLADDAERALVQRLVGA